MFLRIINTKHPNRQLIQQLAANLNFKGSTDFFIHPVERLLGGGDIHVIVFWPTRLISKEISGTEYEYMRMFENLKIPKVILFLVSSQKLGAV